MFTQLDNSFDKNAYFLKASWLDHRVLVEKTTNTNSFLMYVCHH